MDVVASIKDADQSLIQAIFRYLTKKALRCVLSKVIRLIFLYAPFPCYFTFSSPKTADFLLSFKVLKY